MVKEISLRGGVGIGLENLIRREIFRCRRRGWKAVVAGEEMTGMWRFQEGVTGREGD